MLAQNFKSASELGISEKERDALMKVLVLMETKQMRYVPVNEIERSYTVPHRFDGLFNMNASFAVHDCGTATCIRGAAIAVGGVDFCGSGSRHPSDGLTVLFYQWEGDPNVEQGAQALRNYLTHGHPKWKEVMNVEVKNG